MTQPTPTHQPFERYQLLERLGQGGMAVVHRAWDPFSERDVALKLLVATGERALRRFQREAETMTRLRHPHLVTVYRGGVAAGCPFLAMELVQGQTLEACSDPGRTLPLAEVVGHMRDVARAIQYAHDHGVLHRDLKPANIVIDPSGKARVLDFGVAHLQQGTDERLTQSGAVVGTPAYMPPEQALGKRIDERCDLYALGATLYHALCGFPPYADQAVSPLVAVHRAPPTPLRELCQQRLPRRLQAAVKRCLAKDPSQRWPSAGALAAELDEVLEEFDTPRSVVPWALAAMAVLALGALGVWATLRDPPPPPSAPSPTPSQRLRAHTASLRQALEQETATLTSVAADLEAVRRCVAEAPPLQPEVDRTLSELGAALLERALAAARSGNVFQEDTASRFALASELLRHDPRACSLARFEHVRYLLFRGRHEAAHAAARELATSSPSPSLALQARYLASLALGRNGLREESKAELHALTQDDPDGIVGRTARASLVAKTWDYDSSNAILRKVLEEDPAFYPARLLLALGLSFRSQGSVAREVLAPCLETTPDNYRVHSMFGYSYMHDDPDASIAAFTRSMQLTAPWFDTAALKWRGIVAMRVGRLSEARADLDRVLDVKPSTDTRIWRGLVRWRQGEREQAGQDWKRACRDDPKQFRRRMGDMPRNLRETIWRIGNEE